MTAKVGFWPVRELEIMPRRIAGVYWLIDHNGVFYVGMSMDIVARVMDHRVGMELWRTGAWARYVEIAIQPGETAEDHRNKIRNAERTLILALQPEFNRDRVKTWPDSEYLRWRKGLGVDDAAAIGAFAAWAATPYSCDGWACG